MCERARNRLSEGRSGTTRARRLRPEGAPHPRDEASQAPASSHSSAARSPATWVPQSRPDPDSVGEGADARRDKAPERDPHQRALIEAAGRLGVRCEDLLESWGVDVVRYSKAGRSALVLDGCTTTALGHVAEVICANKRATCALLSELALPVPNAVVVEPGQSRAAILRDLPSDRPLVCKPLEGTNGEGVVMGLVDDAAIVEAVEACWRRGPALVEAQIPGADLRIHVIGRRVVAACERRPAAVTGDGRSTVAELVAARDAEVQAHNPQNRLQLDAASHALLAAAGCTLSDVLAKGRVLPLKTVANIAQGATPVDITHLLHPRYQAWVARIGASLSLDIFALDVLALDPMADPAQGGAVILEVNARPQWLHHTFSQGQTHDVAAMLLTALLEDR